MKKIVYTDLVNNISPKFKIEKLQELYSSIFQWGCRVSTVQTFFKLSFYLFYSEKTENIEHGLSEIEKVKEILNFPTNIIWILPIDKEEKQIHDEELLYFNDYYKTFVHLIYICQGNKIRYSCDFYYFGSKYEKNFIKDIVQYLKFE